jgi:hypothetical protein
LALIAAPPTAEAADRDQRFAPALGPDAAA